MQDVNPYLPPAATVTQVTRDSSPRFFASLVPATLALGLTLFVWVILVSTFDRVVAHYLSMPMWSLTLLLSGSLSIFAISRIWRSDLHPLAFGFVYLLFGVAFLIAEGDTSNGTSYWNMAFVYGTLLALPFAAYVLTRLRWQRKHGQVPFMSVDRQA